MDITASIFSGGSPIFLGVVIVFLGAVIYGLYTTRGSGISETPYGNRYGGAPGATGKKSDATGKDHHQAYSGRGMK